MTCPRCIPMCATTEAQHANRQRNMGREPNAVPFPCPGCGSMEWATTREQIREEPKRKWWLWRWEVPTWQTLRIAHAVVGVACIAIAMIDAPSWRMVDTFVGAWNLAAAFYCGFMIRSAASFKRMEIICNEMLQLNRELLSTPMFIFKGDDDEPPLAPRLH